MLSGKFFLGLGLLPTLACSASLNEHLGDLEATLRPGLEASPRDTPVEPAASHFNLAPLSGVFALGQCTAVALADEQSSCVRVEICPECAQ